MKKFTFLLAMMLVTFTACHNEDFEEISLESKREKISYEVTPEEAVSRLGMFLSNNGTRASLNDVTIKTLMKSDFVPATRSTDAEDAPAVYLIDIPDGGCAVMGADKRLEPVYAIMDETKLSPEDLVVASTRTESTEDEDIQTFVTGLINDAVEADIMGLGSFPIDTTELIPNPLPHQEEWYDTTYTCKVSPLLKTKWHQGSPFNNNYPICNTGERKSAGCGVIAAAQLVYYNKLPENYGGMLFDWNLLSKFEYPQNPTSSANTAMANFIYKIAIGVGADLNNLEKKATTTYYNNVKSFFKYNGYPYANFYPYALSIVESMLSNSKPVIIRGNDSINNAGHCWIIDGCEIIKIEHWIKEYIYPVPIVGDTYNQYLNANININMVHCNYGWGGCCDGYYSSGVFDIRNYLPNQQIDFSAGDLPGTDNYAFDANIKIMQY